MGVPPPNPAPFLFAAPKRKGGKRKALNTRLRSRTFRRLHGRLTGNTSPPSTAQVRTSKASGVPAVPTTEPVDRRRTEEQSPNQATHWRSVHRRKPARVCGGLVGRYPARLARRSSQVDAGSGQDEPDAQSTSGPRPDVVYSAPFFSPLFFGAAKKRGSGAGVKPLRAVPPRPPKSAGNSRSCKGPSDRPLRAESGPRKLAKNPSCWACRLVVREAFPNIAGSESLLS